MPEEELNLFHLSNPGVAQLCAGSMRIMRSQVIHLHPFGISAHELVCTSQFSRGIRGQTSKSAQAIYYSPTSTAPVPAV
jgi:hypothetical protein